MLLNLMENHLSNLIFILLNVEPGIFMFIVFVLAMIGFALYRQFLEQKNEELRVEMRRQAIEKRVALAERYLEYNYLYYQQLSEAGKAKFLARMRVVLANKRIMGMDGLVITREMQILTCAAFVQVTFGLTNFRLPKFRTIGIYPDVYVDRRLKRELKGSTQPVGLIRFSWKHLKHGFAIPDDGINLALHELAHALKLTVEEQEVDIDEQLTQELYEFVETSSPLRSAILEGKVTAIRKYASVNSDELFACCVEYFFENPNDFKLKLPQVYEKMCRILNQDATNVSGDFAYREPLQKTRVFKLNNAYEKLSAPILNKHVEDKKYSWTGTLMLLGIFLGPLLMIIRLSSVESDGSYIFLYFLSVFIVGLVFFSRKLYYSGYMSSFVFFAFLTFGWMFPAGIAGLYLNMAVPVHVYEVEDYQLIRSSRQGNTIFISRHSELQVVRDGVTIDPLLSQIVGRDLDSCKLVTVAYYGIFGIKESGSSKLVCGGKDYPL